jgi:hypothetical protein
VTDSHDPDQGVAVPVGPVSGFIYSNTASPTYSLGVTLTDFNTAVSRVSDAVRQLVFTFTPPPVQALNYIPQSGNVHHQLTSTRRAETLLMECLTDEQRVDYKVNHWIEVTSNTDNLWRVHTDHIIGNVQLLVMKTCSPKLQYWRDRWRNSYGDESGPKSFCAHLRYVPAADTFLAQILTLRHNEEEFLRVARPF